MLAALFQLSAALALQIEITERTMAHVGSNEVLIVGGVGCKYRRSARSANLL